ncbi:MAG: hypothetical protein JRH18_04080 [Deltaproteobacteria bacterium]|nr:hypothetical protein [Deltaproteobacteria bacterium]MBW2150825.1 hypothetical protein [Deltaproteobacteria bacterium]
MKYLIRFTDDLALSPSMVGNKFYTLAKAYRLGFPVPEAVAISTQAHRFFLTHQKWPRGLLQDVINMAGELGLANGLSIRSSATKEDMKERSFAGQYRSFLGITSETDLKEKIEICWKSGDTERVQSYLRSGKHPEISKAPPLMAVIMQKQISATVSGVAFGKNPMNPAREEVVIEAVMGLAESLVSGRVTPYRALVKPPDIVHIESPDQDEMLDKQPDKSPLTNAQWCSVAQLVKALEQKLGICPLDIEWAYDESQRLWLIQSRAVTAMKAEDDIAPAGIWTRKIADDLWAERLTPFMADIMLGNSHRFDLSSVLPTLGIADIKPKLAVINGYLYVNCSAIEPVISKIPSKLRIEEIRSLFPPEFNMDRIPSPSIVKLLFIVARVLLFLFKTPRANPIFCAHMALRKTMYIDVNLENIDKFPEDDPFLSFRKLSAAVDAFVRILENNQWPYLYAVVLTWFCRWLMVELLGVPYGEFLIAISHNARNVSLDIEREFRKMAQKIKDDKRLLDRFLNETPIELMADLPAALAEDIQGFLSRYGCRARHRTLLVKRWAEAPEQVLRILKSLVCTSGTRLTEMAEVSFFSCTDKRSSKINPALQPFVRLGLRFTQRYLDLRENLRFLLDKSLYLIRRCLLTLGSQLALGDKVFFLTMEEITRIINRKMTPKKAASIVSERWQNFLIPSEPSTYLIDGRAVNEFLTTGHILRGLGTSAGTATGPARVIEDPGAAEIRQGDILITKNTDPGWTPILSIVKGIVAEQGGLLNHCSIVARELGIPVIVGVQGATKKIPNGTMITIDGGSGLIRLKDTTDTA